MVDWALEKYFPLIKVVRNYHDISSEAKVSIQYIDTLNIDCLPVTFTTEISLDFNNFIHYMVCVSKDLKLSLPISLKKYDWIIFNIQQIGYYRVNYDDENWQRISNYLNSDDYTKIHVLNRAQIIDDAFHLMITGQLNFSIFLNLTSYLHQEKDYIAWYPMFKALEYIFSTFPVAMLENGTCSFTNCIKLALIRVLERIKYEEINDTDQLRICLRQEAARWACFLGDITCMKVANMKLKQHCEQPKTYRLMPWWKEWTYCKGLMITPEKENTWEIVLVTIPAALIIIINNVYSVNQTKLIEEFVERWKTDLADIINIINNTTNLFISCHVEKDLATQNFDRIKRKILIRNNQINRQIQFYESIRFNQ
ncbi:aminopeptidase N-like [Nylanderia fulva]|uniref:aminopeptidase N-like n=2 Tax=Nylanderia fulva TaxID=613905 RepID=UPI0010FB541E|nr:aminopeptidase N-like [Nylanderia fulva]